MKQPARQSACESAPLGTPRTASAYAAPIHTSPNLYSQVDATMASNMARFMNLSCYTASL